MKNLNRFLYNPDSTQTLDILTSLNEEGYAIVENVLDAETLASLKQEIDPWLEVTVPDADNAFMGGGTKRFGRLVYRIPSTHNLILNPTVNALCENVLCKATYTYQIHFTGVMHVMEGETAQVLHRDVSPFVNPHPTVVIAAMWAGTDFTAENGATVFIPGSHKWDDTRQPLKEELAQAEMKAGSVFLYAGNLMHGAGQCHKGERTGIMIQYCSGWMRQEENQYLAVPKEAARWLPTDLQKLLGYDLTANHWGYVDQIHPMDFLNGTEGQSLSPEGYGMSGRPSLKAELGEINPGHRYTIKD